MMGHRRRGLWLAGLAVVIVGAGVAARDACAGTAGPQATKYAAFEVHGSLPESRPPVYLFETDGGTLYELLDRMEKARQDSGVKGLVVRLASLDCGWARAQELRQAMSRARKDGKDVVCVLQEADNLSYYVATAADRIYMAPAGHLMLVGLRAEALYVKGLLDKVGVKAEVVQVGRYKSAAEELTRTEPSPAVRESLESVLQDYYDQLVAGIAQGRSMPVSRVDVLIRRGPYAARRAREAGLIDGVMFPDELAPELAKRQAGEVEIVADYGRPKQPRAAGLDLTALFRMLMGTGGPGAPAPSSRPAIAVVHASGPIMSVGEEGVLFGGELVDAGRLIATIRQAARDVRVRGIVLRIDSPGGSALASDMIWRELRLADRRKPVIASFSDTAASGGYYIASGARKIYAEPGTLTGSIGIFSVRIVVTDLLAKIGLNVTVIERGGSTGLMSMVQELSDDDRRKLQDMLDEGYQLFLERVAETRPKMAPEDVERVAQGRIWTGDQARRNGLVDELGGLQDAVSDARKAAGLTPEQDVEVLHLPRSRNLTEMILFGGGDEVRAPDLFALTGLPRVAGLRSYLGALLMLQRETTISMMPALVTVR